MLIEGLIILSPISIGSLGYSGPVLRALASRLPGTVSTWFLYAREIRTGTGAGT